jgi:hypothetical protein
MPYITQYLLILTKFFLMKNMDQLTFKISSPSGLEFLFNVIY